MSQPLKQCAASNDDTNSDERLLTVFKIHMPVVADEVDLIRTYTAGCFS